MKMFRRCLPLIVASTILLVAGPAGAAPPELEAELHRLIQGAVAEHRLPSLSVAVARHGEVVFAAAAGFAELENAIPATPESAYPIGSVTKPLTAVAALRLHDAGRLDLDAPVRNQCPAFPAPAQTVQPVTVRQLLGHLGGIRGYDYRRFEEDYLNKRLFPSTEEALVRFSGDPLVAEPGTRFVYSSFGYVLVGCALEGAAGAPYGELLREQVLAPAGMARTGLDDPRKVIPFRVRGYSLADDGSWVPVGCFNPSDRYPAGGLVSTPTDLVRFGSALLTGKLLSEPSRTLLWEVQRTADGEPTGSGLGWTIGEGGREISHGGTTVGGTALLYLRPADGVAVAVATNLSLWTEGRQELAAAIADRIAATPATP